MRALPVMIALFLSIPAICGTSLANDPPRILSLSAPQNGTIDNPLNISIVAQDPENGNLTYSWYLDGELIGEGPGLTYYLFPGARNVTLVISDPEGNSISRSWVFSATPPPGWGDRPDNDRNRAIFWSIFGIFGTILILVLAFILFRKK